jgi:hypothetical protein
MKITKTTLTNKRGGLVRNILIRGGVNVRGCVILGNNVIIDSYLKYADRIRAAMTGAGFTFADESNGEHLDGTFGPRFVYKLPS